MTLAEFKSSISPKGNPPETISPELKALWLAKAGRWEAAHNLAQEIETPMGSWIHALLHLIEGDTGNAGPWFARARKPARKISEIDSEWDAIATALLG